MTEDEWRNEARGYGRPSHPYECCCHRCLGEAPDDDRDESDASPLAQRMEAAGYEIDSRGVWVRRLRPTFHVARKDHADGRIKAGMRYCSVVTYRVDEYGGGSRRTYRWPVVTP